MSSEKARRRRGSSYFEDSSRTKRFTRQSLPCISFSGTTTLANPSLGTRQGIEMEPGVRSRRLSNLSFNLAGVSGNLVPAVETGAKAENAVETGAKDETPEVEYLFPLWCVASLPPPPIPPLVAPLRLLHPCAAWQVVCDSSAPRLPAQHGFQCPVGRHLASTVGTDVW
jgi:hypothetical protein